MMWALVQQLKIYAFHWYALVPKYEAKFYEEVPAMVAKGELKYKEDKTFGLENVGEACLAVQTGENTGKSVIIVAEE